MEEIDTADEAVYTLCYICGSLSRIALRLCGVGKQTRVYCTLNRRVYVKSGMEFCEPKLHLLTTTTVHPTESRVTYSDPALSRYVSFACIQPM